MSTEAEERAAARRAGLDYDAICMANMIARFIRGEKPPLEQLPFSSRWLVTCYLAQNDAARAGLPGLRAYDQGTGRWLTAVPALNPATEHTPPNVLEDIIDAEVIDDDD